MNNMLATLPLLVGLATFGTVASLWCIAVLLWSTYKTAQERRRHTRLGLGPDASAGGSQGRMLRLWREGKAVTMFVPEGPKKVGRMRRVVNEMGWDISPLALLAALAGSGLLGFSVAALLFKDAVLALAVGTGLVMLPWMYLSGKLTKREQLFNQQFSEALGIASRSLRAGHPLGGAFQLISEEIDPPVGDVFAEIVQQQSLGMSLEDAILKTNTQRTSPELALFAASIIIQSRSGGNLAETMEGLADVIRDRTRMIRRAQALTAQVQLSKRVLVGIPFFTALLIRIVDPNYLRPLFDTAAGKIMTVVAGVLLVVGIWIMNRMSTLEY